MYVVIQWKKDGNTSGVWFIFGPFSWEEAVKCQKEKNKSNNNKDFSYEIHELEKY